MVSKYIPIMGWDNRMNNILNVGVFGTEGVNIPPLIQYYTDVVVKEMLRVDSARSVIILPARHYWARWISVLATLSILREKAVLQASAFEPGQLIVLNGFVVEYVGVSIGKNPKITVKTGDNGLYSVPISGVYQMQKSIDSSHRLAKLRDISLNYENNDNLLDHIVNARTRVIRILNKFIFISGIGESKEFLFDHQIQGKSISNVLRCSVIRSNGALDSISEDKVEDSLFLVSPDFFRIDHYMDLNKGIQLSGIFVDGPKYFIEAAQIVEERFSAEKIPIIILADLTDAAEINVLRRWDFSVIPIDIGQLDDVLLNTKHRKTVFSPFESIASNLVLDSINYQKCSFPNLEGIWKDINSFRTVINNDVIEEMFDELSILTLSIARVAWHPSEKYMGGLLKNLGYIQDRLHVLRIWINQNKHDDIVKIFDDLKEILVEVGTVEFDKYSKLIEIILNASANNSTLVITKSHEEAEDVINFLRNKRFNRKLYSPTVLSIVEVDIEQLSAFNRVVFCGWFNREKILRMLLSFYCSDIVLLLYPFEETWFRNAYAAIKGMLVKGGIENAPVYYQDNHLRVDISKSFEDDEFDLQIRERFYQRIVQRLVQKSGNYRDVRTCGAIRMSCGDVYFSAINNQPLIIKNLWNDRVAIQLVQKSIEEIQPGEYLVEGETDHNIIRTRVDAELIKMGKPEIREQARLWVDALEDLLNKLNGNISRLTARLAAAGCRKHEVTVRNWMQNPDIIGPRDLNDINVVAIVTRFKPLLDNINSVIESVRILRSLHIQTGHRLRRALVEKIRSKSRPSLMENGADYLSLDIDEFGTLNIWRIGNIDQGEYSIPDRFVNRVIRGDFFGTHDSAISR